MIVAGGRSSQLPSAGPRALLTTPCRGPLSFSAPRWSSLICGGDLLIPMDRDLLILNGGHNTLHCDNEVLMKKYVEMAVELHSKQFRRADLLNSLRNLRHDFSQYEAEIATNDGSESKKQVRANRRHALPSKRMLRAPSNPPMCCNIIYHVPGMYLKGPWGVECILAVIGTGGP
eukprot:1179653-Prorocentrum_minimum.AAC.1